MLRPVNLRCASRNLPHRGPVPFNGNAEFFQGQLGVIASAGRLGDAGVSFREQSRQQYRGFHLCTGHRHFIVDAAQFSAANFEGCKIFVACADSRTHLPQRSQDALHRPLIERIVAGYSAGEILSRQNSGE